MVAANKQSRTALKDWFSNLGVGYGNKNFSPSKISLLQNVKKKNSELDGFFGQIRAKSQPKKANRCFENVAQFGYLGTRVTNQNLNQEEIKRSLNSVNTCYHSAQKLLYSRLLYKNVKIRI
jgi:hypothetical protein